MGGVSLYLAILISTTVFYTHNLQLYTLLASLTIIVIFGIIDDLRNIKPFTKLTGHFLAAIILVLFNTTEFTAILESLDQLLYFRGLSYLLVIIWVVAITNAFNLIDGLDGLAVGNAIIIGGFLIVLSVIYGNMWALGISIILVGACLGFFPFNYKPARIFLGDTGSTLLGFTLASVFLFNISYEVPKFIIFGAVFLFMYPTVDMAYAVLRRLKERSPVMSADMNHIHHHILRQGLPPNYVVYLLYLFSFLLGVCGVVLLSFSQWTIFGAVFAVLAVAMLLVYLFKYFYKSYIVSYTEIKKRSMDGWY